MAERTDKSTLAPNAAQAARLFLRRLPPRYAISRALLFGSRAHGAGRPDSDVDVAVILRGEPGRRADAAVEMAGIAFDVLLETGLLVEALPLWEGEWEHPERFSNPTLLENICREGVGL